MSVSPDCMLNTCDRAFLRLEIVGRAARTYYSLDLIEKESLYMERYEVADLDAAALQQVRDFEQKLQSASGKKIALVAYSNDSIGAKNSRSV